ncbi:TetR/AcrR family transcriptional regulator C-terminal domain-containing protein [Hyalangium versicolor]|uniref:TetR/AcrR family transcriptional regulator C-terminal domain-containing protein n=1 Tax=Hyalangium versicolor TaxID=2861190 RepID=UPI001CCA9A21|nr:TetR/AcrR family transcriptional regulator C-terminal domain-containing protein [Hyalangium versicolor]
MRLDTELVVRTALQLLNEVGLEGLSLRRIAKELDVQAPALYWHFKSKQDLLDEMATTMLRDFVTATGQPDPKQPWDEWMMDLGRNLHQMLLGYRDGAKVFSGTHLTDSTLYEALEFVLRKLTGAGFSLRDAVQGYNITYSYTIGFTIEEQAVHPRPGERDSQYDEAQRASRIDAEKFPLALAAGKEMFTGFDERFEQGLRVIIAGLAPLLPPRR